MQSKIAQLALAVLMVSAANAAPGQNYGAYYESSVAPYVSAEPTYVASAVYDAKCTDEYCPSYVAPTGYVASTAAPYYDSAASTGYKASTSACTGDVSDATYTPVYSDAECHGEYCPSYVAPTGYVAPTSVPYYSDAASAPEYTDAVSVPYYSGAVSGTYVPKCKGGEYCPGYPVATGTAVYEHPPADYTGDYSTYYDHETKTITKTKTVTVPCTPYYDGHSTVSYTQTESAYETVETGYVMHVQGCDHTAKTCKGVDAVHVPSGYQNVDSESAPVAPVPSQPVYDSAAEAGPAKAAEECHAETVTVTVTSTYTPAAATAATYGTPSDSAYGTPNDSTYGTPSDSASDSTYGTPSDSTYDTPSDSTYGTPSDSASDSTYGTPSDTTYDASHVDDHTHGTSSYSDEHYAAYTAEHQYCSKNSECKEACGTDASCMTSWKACEGDKVCYKKWVADYCDAVEHHSDAKYDAATGEYYPTSTYAAGEYYPTSTYAAGEYYPTSTYAAVEEYPTSSYAAVEEYPTSSYAAVEEYPTSTYAAGEYPTSTYAAVEEYPTSTYAAVEEYPTSTYAAVEEYPTSSYAAVEEYPASTSTPCTTDTPVYAAPTNAY